MYIVAPRGCRDASGSAELLRGGPHLLRRCCYVYCLYVHMLIYIYIHIHIHTPIPIHIHIYIYIYTCTVVLTVCCAYLLLFPCICSAPSPSWDSRTAPNLGLPENVEMCPRLLNSKMSM